MASWVHVLEVVRMVMMACAVLIILIGAWLSPSCIYDRRPWPFRLVTIGMIGLLITVGSELMH